MKENPTVTVVIAIIAATLLIIQCGGGAPGRPAAVEKNAWVFDGWACAPDAGMPERSPLDFCKAGQKKEYLYMKFSAGAAQKAIDSGDPDRMQSSCREDARQQMAGDTFLKILSDFVDKATGDDDRWAFTIVRTPRGRFKKTGVHNCCAIDSSTGACTKPNKRDDWSQCMCVGYVKLTKKDFDKLVKDEQKE